MDPVVAACQACIASCADYDTLNCPQEVPEGCLYAGELVVDGEKVVCLCK
jgi:hypothetical protein